MLRARSLHRWRRLAVPALLSALLAASATACGDRSYPTAVAPPPSAVGADLVDPAPYANGLYVGGHTWTSCRAITSSNDLDHDGTVDSCENALAAAFAPAMIVQPDCIYADAAPMGLTGDYAYAAQAKSDRVRIAYLPAYYADCGNVYFGQGDGHSGDSELIVVDVAYDATTSHWVTMQVFLSAHCGTSSGGYCQWWDKSKFRYADGKPGGAPEVWVSRWKHANYPSQSICSNAAYTTDECPSSQYYYRFPVMYVQQNVGSADYPVPWRNEALPATASVWRKGGGGVYKWTGTPNRDCRRPFWTNPLLPASTSDRLECWWSERLGGTADAVLFAGWNQDQWGGASESYGANLRTYADFHTGQSVFPQPTTDPSSGVTLSGQTLVAADQPCDYVATMNVGTPPYGYTWRVNGEVQFAYLQSNVMRYTNTGSSYQVTVTVQDATGATYWNYLNVTVSGPARCLLVEE